MEITPIPQVPLFDPARDHSQGDVAARHVLIEYGSYACPHCRDAQLVVDRVRERLGDDLLFVFRHKPLVRDPWSVPAAKLAEGLARDGRFFDAHARLMKKPIRRRQDLVEAAADLGVGEQQLDAWLEDELLEEIVKTSERDAREAGVRTTPFFAIAGRPYDGPWDEMSLLQALDPPVARRTREVMRTFAGWAPATGLLLAFVSILALTLANSPLAEAYHAFWKTKASIGAGNLEFSMSLGHWINDALMAVFFFVVGLEIKREFSIGALASRRARVLPAAAALGGMVMPALIYLAFTGGGTGAVGWGIPMATDIAFTLGLLSLLGRRVPLQLKVFLTALAIVDDMGAIAVIAVFYAHTIDWPSLAFAALALATLAGFNRGGLNAPLPYALVGIVLWYFIYQSGVHATLAGILLALTVPTRRPPNLRGLMAQVSATIRAEIDRLADATTNYPTRHVQRTLDGVRDRLESPAHRLERTLEPWSSFLVLPLFALANAGVTVTLDGLDAAIAGGVIAGLVIGKPLGVFGAVWLITRTNLADWPDDISPRALIGAGLLAGIGFTMSLFIAGEAFSAPVLAASAKIAVLAASGLAAVTGLLLLRFSLNDGGGRSASS